MVSNSRILFTLQICIVLCGISVLGGGIYEEDELWPPTNEFHNRDFIRDEHHMEEHIGDFIDPKDMVEEEFDFHFFQLHDANKDNKLDGLEIGDAISHSLEKQFVRVDARDLPFDEKQQRFRQLYSRVYNIVDLVLSEDDSDNDGYISYAEFAKATRTQEVLHATLD